ncbi:MAG: hypothetical protein HW402_450 [Dehalococcoidales bacterium]|nr:hypothetical protein [Dehalococcoidales bacterium]
MGTTEEKVAHFIVETSDREIGAEAITTAKRSCFDGVGTMLAGVASPPGKMMTTYVKELGGTPESTVVGTGLRTSAPLAALANGTFAHALDYDDTGGGFMHPTCVLLSPLVALGERLGTSGREIINAYVIGLRVGVALAAGCPNYSQMGSGFHGTSTFGVMAATAACARLLKLSVEQTMMALGTAGSMGGGLSQNMGTYTKPLHAGMASHNGIMACSLAREGWTGTEKVLESGMGLLGSYAGRNQFNLEAIRKSLEQPLTVQLIIKKYPCCSGNHATLDSVLSLLKENDISFEDILRVDVENVSHNSSAMLYPEPTSGYQGKFSIPYNVATAMIDKQVNIDSFTDEKLNRPVLRQALSKVVIHEINASDPDYRRRGPEQPVTITLKDGRTFSRATSRGTMLGSPANPLSDAELMAKFRANGALSLPREAVDRACDLWWNMEKMGSISQGMEAVAGKVPIRA